MRMMNILSWILFGIVVGTIAVFIQKDNRLPDIVTTLFLSILGSLLGGLLTNIILGSGNRPYNILAGLAAISASVFILNLSKQSS